MQKGENITTLYSLSQERKVGGTLKNNDTYHPIRTKEKNHMLISINAGKQDKIKQPSKTTLRKLEIKVNNFNLIKGICKKTRANIIRKD